MNRWMHIAYQEALEGMMNNEGGPFGAVIVHNEKIIAAAHNEVLKSNDPTAHAEINVIRIASQKLSTHDLSECILYTTCYPCPMCIGAIFWARIPTVYYGATGTDAAEGGFDDVRFAAMMHNPSAVINFQPLDREKNRELFDHWLAKSDRIAY